MTDDRQPADEWWVEHLEDHSAQGIAATVAQLIRRGEIQSGQRLPTVRGLAALLGVSPATVSAAWSTLRRQGAVGGEGRQGTMVIGAPVAPKPERYGDLTEYWGPNLLDLTIAAPDPALLPPLSPAVHAVLADHDAASYDRAPITPELREAARSTWPWPAEAWVAVNGGYEGLQMVLAGTVVPGDRVAVEDPSTPRTLDILDRLGVRRVPVQADVLGPRPEALRAALESDPVAFVYQPRAGSGPGAALDAERSGALAEVLADTTVLVVEDDGVGEVSSLPYEGLGTSLPGQVVLVRGYSKSHGADLRTAVVAGPEDVLARAHGTREFGSRWTSRLLQDTLAWLLRDDASRQVVEAARAEYRRRRELLMTLLAERDVHVRNRDGLALWVPVANETQALIALASHGIAAIPGSRFRTRPGPPVVRVAACRDLADPQQVVDALARASRAR